MSDTPSSYYQRHIFFCLNQRSNGEACCATHNAQAGFDRCKAQVKAAGLAGPGAVRVNKAGCLDRCAAGPVAVVYPEAVNGPAGAIEALRDEPLHAPQGASVRGVAVIAHPHPLYGGTMNNKVVQTLARAFVQCGFAAVRFNFRGVGASQGVHGHGVGEAADLLAVVDQVAPAGVPPKAGLPAVRACSQSAAAGEAARSNSAVTSARSPPARRWRRCGRSARWKRSCWSAPRRRALT